MYVMDRMHKMGKIMTIVDLKRRLDAPAMTTTSGLPGRGWSFRCLLLRDSIPKELQIKQYKTHSDLETPFGLSS